MTDNEIIKALECCSINGCKNCKYKGKAPDCMTVLQKDTIDLINRQNAEIEGLKKFIEKDQGLILKLTNVPKNEYDNKVKSEVIKDFAERLKRKVTVVHKTHSGKHWYEMDDNEIDNLVKEMKE